MGVYMVVANHMHHGSRGGGLISEEASKPLWARNRSPGSNPNNTSQTHPECGLG